MNGKAVVWHDRAIQGWNCILVPLNNKQMDLYYAQCVIEFGDVDELMNSIDGPQFQSTYDII